MEYEAYLSHDNIGFFFIPPWEAKLLGAKNTKKIKIDIYLFRLLEKNIHQQEAQDVLDSIWSG